MWHCLWMSSSWYFGDATFLQNVRNYLPNDTVSHHGRPEPSKNCCCKNLGSCFKQAALKLWLVTWILYRYVHRFMSYSAIDCKCTEAHDIWLFLLPTAPTTGSSSSESQSCSTKTIYRVNLHKWMVKTGTTNVSWCPRFFYIIFRPHNVSSDEMYTAVTILCKLTEYCNIWEINCWNVNYLFKSICVIRTNKRHCLLSIYLNS